MDVETFLERIREIRDVIPATDADTLRCLTFCLDGIALICFRATRHRWVSWRQFENAFRPRFGAEEFELRKEITRCRTQGEHEPVADFLACIVTLLARMDPPWSLHKKLNIVHRNMLSKL